MRSYGPNGLEIRVGDGRDATIRYYVREVNGHGWRWDAYFSDLGGVTAGYSEAFSRTRDDAVTAVAEHYAAYIGLTTTTMSRTRTTKPTSTDRRH